MITFPNVALNKDWGQSICEIYSSSALALISASRASKSVCWMGSDLDGTVPWGRFVPLGAWGLHSFWGGYLASITGLYSISSNTGSTTIGSLFSVDINPGDLLVGYLMESDT
jgi:hypothetical protein